MNIPNKKDFEIKLGRIRSYMSKYKYAGMILGRRDNFAWVTFGGDNKVFRSSFDGAAVLLITQKQVYLFAYSMDADRIMDDELDGLGIIKNEIKWFEGTPIERAVAFMEEKAVVSDMSCNGVENKNQDIIDLHTPYTVWEKERYEKVGALMDKLFREVADKIEMGMTEQEAASVAAGVFEREKMIPKVLLIGSDERIAKYRHPLPSDKKIEKVMLLHVASERYGLHGNITRMICFGEVPEALEKDYELLNQCCASTFSMLKPGVHYQPILAARRKLMKQAGKEEEMDLHFPGAYTGYNIGGSEPVIADDAIKEDMCFDWFMTVKGAKIEELAMAAPTGGKVLSVAGYWPAKKYTVGDYSCELPIILVK